MELIPRGANFTVSLNAQDLSRGLRVSKRSLRNSGYLVQSSGAVGRDGVLQTLDDMSQEDFSIITDGFPYPQLFVFSNLIIVCGETQIYEMVLGVLTLKITVTAGVSWEAISSGEYVYMSNGKVSVVRDPLDLTYSLSDLPTASCICNFNGQIIIGSPDEDLS